MTFVDSHAHLFAKDFEHDLEDVLQRARDAGITAIVNPGTDLETSLRSIELADAHEMIYACVGVHPHEASKADDRTLERIEELSRHPKVVAIGEIGLDYHYDFSPPERQREIFALQIELAQRCNLPVVIHSREAEADTLAIVERTLRPAPGWRTPRGVFHCFPGDAAMASRVISWGFLISIPGPVTFAAREGKPNTMADVVRAVSLDDLMLETDSPYLAPVPRRGKRNEPSHLTIIAERVAALQQVSVEEVARRTTLAAGRIFGLQRRTP